MLGNIGKSQQLKCHVFQRLNDNYLYATCTFMNAIIWPHGKREENSSVFFQFPAVIVLPSRGIGLQNRNVCISCMQN